MESRKYFWSRGSMQMQTIQLCPIFLVIQSYCLDGHCNQIYVFLFFAVSTSDNHYWHSQFHLWVFGDLQSLPGIVRLQMSMLAPTKSWTFTVTCIHNARLSSRLYWIYWSSGWNGLFPQANSRLPIIPTESCRLETTAGSSMGSFCISSMSGSISFPYQNFRHCLLFSYGSSPNKFRYLCINPLQKSHLEGFVYC